MRSEGRLGMIRVLVAGSRLELRRHLEAQGYDVVETAGGAETLERFPELSPDLLLIDVELTGTEPVRVIRRWSQIPILALSARSGEYELVSALDAGADDFLVVPFAPAELLARIRALLRRAGGQASSHQFTAGAFSIDLARREVRLGGEYVRLTATEYEALRVLVRNAGHVVTYRELIREIWGGANHKDSLHLLRVNVSRLRRKLGRRRILTESGAGYRFASATDQPMRATAA